MNLIIIPIKKHSERLKNKNFLPLNGKALYEHQIDFATQNKGPKDIIILLCQDCFINAPGTQTIIQQNPNLYQDLQEQFREVDYRFLFLLQPTSPIRPRNMIKDLQASLCGGMDSCATFTPLKVKLCQVENEQAEPLNYSFHCPYQSLPQTWKETGQGYGVRKEALEKFGKVLGGKVGAVIVPPEWFALMDIDTQEDFQLYSAMMERGGKMPDYCDGKKQ